MRSWTTDKPERVVRLKLEIDDSRVLLSDFDLWHIPLNFGYFAVSEEESDDFDARCRQAGIPYGPLRQLCMYDGDDPERAALSYELVHSWRRCLGLPENIGGADSGWLGNVSDDAVQAVFWELRAEDVKSVERFTTRRAARY